MEAKNNLNLPLPLNPMRPGRVDAIGKPYRKPAVEPNRTTSSPLNPAAKGKSSIISTMYITWLRKPTKAPPIIPERITANVCRIIGIGVKGK